MIGEAEIMQQVHSRTYYLVERAKREDSSLALAQSSSDDLVLLKDFYREAMTVVNGKLAKENLDELLEGLYSNDGVERKVLRKGAERNIPLLMQAISQYTVEYIVWRWFCHVLPGWKYENYMELRSQEIDKYISRIAPIPRRRPTDLAGI